MRDLLQILANQVLGTVLITIKRVLNTPPDAIYRLYSEVDFYEQRFVESGLKDFQQTVFQQSEHHLEIGYELYPRLKLPKMLKRLQPDQRVQYQMIWQRTAGCFEGRFCYQGLDLPVAVKGQIELSAHPTGTHFFSQSDLHCEIPMIGASIVRLMRTRVEQELIADLEALALRLACQVQPMS